MCSSALLADRRGGVKPSSHLLLGALVFTLGCTVLVVLGSLAYRSPSMQSGFPEDYSFSYGEDRPFAPSLAGTENMEAYDPRLLSGSLTCGTAGCHEQIVEEWQPSAHRWAAMDAGFQRIQMNMAEQNGPDSTRYCGGCHDPISLFSGTKNLFTDTEKLTSLHGYQEGVSCLACHSIREVFHNNGDGTFSEVAAKAGVGNPAGRGLSAAWADYDLDGLPDLYVANDVSDNALFRNRGDGTFEDVSHPAWVADYRGAMGLAVADWDNDGDSDIFVTHWIAQENGFYWNMARSASPSETGPLLKFTDVADMLGLGQISLNDIGWGTSFLDYDNDGRLDLFVVNGSTFQREEDPSHLVAMRNRLFWQKSTEDGFFDVSMVSGEALSEERVSRGAAFADYDNDGDIDIFVINHQDAPTLLRNENNSENHWLKVRVACVQSNRSGLGTRVEIQTPLGKQRRELGVQSSYLSQNALEAHFGLGSAASVNQVRVVFPSGAVRTLENVPSNQIVVVKE